MSKINRDIVVNPVFRGYVVRVGCMTMVYLDDDHETMIFDLREYLNDPIGKENRMREMYGEETSDSRQLAQIPEGCVVRSTPG